jgi:hypothetical protein
MERVEFATFGVRAAARLLDDVVAIGVVGFVGGIIGLVILTLLSVSGLAAWSWQARIRGFSSGYFGFSLLSNLSPASRGGVALGILLGCSSGLAISAASWVVKGLYG